MHDDMQIANGVVMRLWRYLDPRAWFPGDEVADGMLEFGLEDFLPGYPIGDMTAKADEIDDQ